MARTFLNWRRALAGLAFAALSIPGAVQAATQVTQTFQVTLTITAACAINSASALNFGSSGMLVANIDQSSTISVQCTNSTPYTVGLDPGVGTGASVTSRKMTNGVGTVAYSLYSDAGRSMNWGQTPGTDTVAGTGNGAAQTLTVYGRVPPQTTPAPATYSDTITVTLTY